MALFGARFDYQMRRVLAQTRAMRIQALDLWRKNLSVSGPSDARARTCLIL